MSMVPSVMGGQSLRVHKRKENEKIRACKEGM